MKSLDAVFLAALVCGCVAAVKGHRTAAALVAGAAFTAEITLLRVPFDPALWVAIDLAVILAILQPKLTTRDYAVIGLFVPVWVLYAVNPAWISDAVTAIVAVQFLLTFPPELARKALNRAKDTFRYRDEWTNIDPRVVA